MARQPDDLSTLPKVELHVHLEGTVSAEVASDLARRHGQDPATVLELESGGYPRRYRDFPHFVDTFVATSRQIRDPDDLERVAEAFAQMQDTLGVRYCETTFTAIRLVDDGWAPADIWRALANGFADADVEIRLIIDVVRDMGAHRTQDTIRLVADADAPIVAFGLTGIEGSVPEGAFRPLRDAADRLGIGLVAHAGETGTPDNIRAALDDLGADRIGHGVAAATDADLLERLARDGTVLEVCPSSNVTLGVVDDLAAHPLPALLAAGVAVTINSDDPPFFATTLTDELAHAATLANLTRDDLADLQRTAIDASYAGSDVRARVHGEIDAWQAGGSDDTGRAS
ncbi:MAG: adenosine deaminase [Nitriliruptoraceae bacterium]